jgi:outer membrane protein OmpA-like peptidoglycan-associated protein
MQAVTESVTHAGAAALATGLSTTTTSTTTTRRYWLRRDPPLWPFIWRGLLPLLGLLALGLFALRPFAKNEIEAEVRRGVQEQLLAKGMGWVQVGVSGQNVVLQGTPPVAAAGDAALLAGREALCPTWRGPKWCAVQVTGDFDKPAPLAAAAAPAPKPAAAAPTPAPAAAAQACQAKVQELLATSRIEFDTSSATIRARSKPLLDGLAEAVKSCPGKVQIEGHTDSVGQAASNQTLSEARAQSVVAALVARGVAADRLGAAGYGPSKPLASNDTAEGRSKNRRIEFKAAGAN